jgi:predicted permease
MADSDYIAPDYLGTMGITLKQGRDFSIQDRMGAPGVIIINEAMARKHFPDGNPIGQRIHVDQSREIIGVAGDIRPNGLDVEPKPHLFLPYAQKPTAATFFALAVKTTGKPMDLAHTVERVVQTLDSDLPVSDVRALEDLVSASIAQRGSTAWLLVGFAMFAVSLAAVGIYGVMACWVAQRTREIGLRMALGAQRHEVLAMILHNGMRLTLVGVGIGLLGSFIVTRLISTQLHGVQPTDPFTFMSVSAALVGAAFLACLIPARRAAKVDPMEALRYE